MYCSYICSLAALYSLYALHSSVISFCVVLSLLLFCFLLFCYFFFFSLFFILLFFFFFFKQMSAYESRISDWISDVCSSDLLLAQLLGNYAFDAARRLWSMPRQAMTAPLITDRQRDCVQWAARGKSDWETSQILDISRETVTSHIKEACARYQVNKRILLVGRTLGDGTLTISDIGGWCHPHFWE